jgi:hypothetical protein
VVLDWNTVALAIISPMVTLFIGVYSLHLIKKRYYLIKRQHQANGLHDAFNVLNNREHRQSRKKVYQSYSEYEKNKDIKIFDNPQVEEVRADIDIIGMLVKTGNIDKEQFMIGYGPLVYRCWVCLKDSIENERKIRNFMQYMQYMRILNGLLVKQTNIGKERMWTYPKLDIIIASGINLRNSSRL